MRVEFAGLPEGRPLPFENTGGPSMTRPLTTWVTPLSYMCRPTSPEFGQRAARERECEEVDETDVADEEVEPESETSESESKSESDHA